MKNFFLSLGLGFFSLLIGAAALEGICRWYLIPKAVLPEFTLQKQASFFSLVSSYRNEKVTIQNARREKAPREGRLKNIAFIGDSVTFCAVSSDENCFSEILQTSQNEYDVYNYGVVGYGLVQIEEQLKRALAERKFDTIYYVYNFNDVHQALPYPLELIQTPKDRFVSLEDYEASGKTKLWLKDHLKFPFVVRHLWSALRNREVPRAAEFIPSPKGVEPAGNDCHATLEERITAGGEGFYFSKIYPAWKKIYFDDATDKRLVETLSRMRQMAESKSVRLVLAPFHDYVFFSKSDASLNNRLADLSRQAGVEYLDTFGLFAAHATECGFYADVAHLGDNGNRYFADYLKGNIMWQNNIATNAY